MNYITRNAKMEDASKLNKLLTKLICDEKKYDNNINDNFVVKNYYENIINAKNKIIIVAEADNKIVGYVYGFIVDNGDVCIDLVAQFDAMYIEEGYRNLGIANSLINKFIDWAKAENVKFIELKVCNENVKAISLYEKNGFKSFKNIMKLDIN